MVEWTNWQRMGFLIMMEAAFTISAETRTKCGEAPLTRSDFLLTASAAGSELALRQYQRYQVMDEFARLLRKLS